MAEFAKPPDRPSEPPQEPQIESIESVLAAASAPRRDRCYSVEEESLTILQGNVPRPVPAVLDELTNRDTIAEIWRDRVQAKFNGLGFRDVVVRPPIIDLNDVYGRLEIVAVSQVCDGSMSVVPFYHNFWGFESCHCDVIDSPAFIVSRFQLREDEDGMDTRFSVALPPAAMEECRQRLVSGHGGYLHFLLLDRLRESLAFGEMALSMPEAAYTAEDTFDEALIFPLPDPEHGIETMPRDPYCEVRRFIAIGVRENYTGTLKVQHDLRTGRVLAFTERVGRMNVWKPPPAPDQ